MLEWQLLTVTEINHRFFALKDVIHASEAVNNAVHARETGEITKPVEGEPFL